jgi:hypothetical protein
MAQKFWDSVFCLHLQHEQRRAWPAGPLQASWKFLTPIVDSNQICFQFDHILYSDQHEKSRTPPMRWPYACVEELHQNCQTYPSSSSQVYSWPMMRWSISHRSWESWSYCPRPLNCFDAADAMPSIASTSSFEGQPKNGPWATGPDEHGWIGENCFNYCYSL